MRIDSVACSKDFQSAKRIAQGEPTSMHHRSGQSIPVHSVSWSLLLYDRQFEQTPPIHANHIFIGFAVPRCPAGTLADARNKDVRSN